MAPAAELKSDFRLSREDVALGRHILSARGGRLSLADLEFDDYSAYWRDMLGLCQRHYWGNGLGETVAVVDSGISRDIAGTLGVDEAKSLDLTGEGLSDPSGHGTAVSTLVHLTAPSATQYHVKLFDSRQRIPGAGYEEKVALIKRAFDHIEKTGATLVNISWNHLTRIDLHPVDVRPRFCCHCPICKVVTEFVERTNVDVFVSEGNSLSPSEVPDLDTPLNRPLGAWSCPAAAAQVIPVLGYSKGQARYDNNLGTASGVPAPAHIRLPRRRGLLPALLSKLRLTEPASISGSSFATPLVVGTYAAIRSAFKEKQYDHFNLPRSLDSSEGAGSTSYDFALDVFFVPPDDPAKSKQELHEVWRVLFVNGRKRSMQLYEKKDLENAGQLLCFIADLASIPYRRMANWKGFGMDLGPLMMGLYLDGISLLHASELAHTADTYIEKARALHRLLAERGMKNPEVDRTLTELTAYHAQNRLQFMWRLGGSLDGLTEPD